MRSRLPLILVALTILLALFAAGCGSGNSDPNAEPVAPLDAPASKSDDIVSSGGDAVESAKEEVDKQKSNVDKETSDRIDQAMRDARAQCRKAANNIPNEEAKTTALKTCAKIK